MSQRIQWLFCIKLILEYMNGSKKELEGLTPKMLSGYLKEKW